MTLHYIFLIFHLIISLKRLLSFFLIRNDFVNDFEAMIARKKEESSRRRKRHDIDLINDNDDIIDQLIQNMRQAAEVNKILEKKNFFH